MFAQIAISIVSGVVIAILTSYVTVRLSLWQFRSERWWERKVELYSDVLEALYRIRSHAANFVDGVDMKTEELSLEGRKEVERAISVGTLLMSEEAVTYLREFQRESRNIMINAKSSESDARDQRGLEYAREELKETDSCLEKIRVCAKKDLRIENHRTNSWSLIRRQL